MKAHWLIQNSNNSSLTKVQDFILNFSQLKNDEQRIWLMLFELYDRQFKGRNSEEKDLQARLYKESEVTGGCGIQDK